MKVRLNKRMMAEACDEGPGGCHLCDTEIPGFGPFIYSANRKSFLITDRS